jgi:D-3-phosphoglycerate dehydrogenase
VDRPLFDGVSIRCRVIAVPATGLDHIDLDACSDHGIRVVSLRGETEFLRDVRATAELTIALMLSLLRRIPEAAASVRSGVWNRDLFRGRELYGKTAGIVGMGRLGMLVAEYLNAFGMRVIGHDPRHEVLSAIAERAETLDELLRSSDVVTLHVSYSPATHHLIGRDQMALMRPSAVLVNTSRGDVIDESALLDALSSGRLAGAALDVLSGEPSVSPDHPVVRAARSMPNLLVVPHIGGNTVESAEKTDTFLAGRVVRALGRDGRA